MKDLVRLLTTLAIFDAVRVALDEGSAAGDSTQVFVIGSGASARTLTLSVTGAAPPAETSGGMRTSR